MTVESTRGGGRVADRRVMRALRRALTPAAVLLLAWAALAGPQASTASAWPLPAASDRSHKADLLARLGYAPKLVFFGGSRSLRFEPAYARRLSGLRGFNAACVECTPEDVWALSHHLMRRCAHSADKPLYVMWGIQPGIFSNKQFDAALVGDTRLSRYFSSGLRASMGSGLPHFWANRTYLRDGAMVWDNYDRLEQSGRTLQESLAIYIRRALRKHGEGTTVATHDTRARRYFEATLAYLNEHGCEPLLIVMPVHPKVIAAVRDDAWDARRASLMAYFTELQKRYYFTVLDFTFIDSFDGLPSAFYDGVHMKQANMRRLLRAAVGKAPWAFGLAPAPWQHTDRDGGWSTYVSPKLDDVADAWRAAADDTATAAP